MSCKNAMSFMYFKSKCFHLEKLCRHITGHQISYSTRIYGKRLLPNYVQNLKKLESENTDCFTLAPSHVMFRKFHSTVFSNKNEEKKKPEDDGSYSTTFIYLCSAMITMFGAAYAAVPLYKIFCSKVGLGGDPKIGHKIDSLQTMEPIRARKIKVTFNANANASMLWNFKPSQNEITVVPGETALAFYTARNPTDEPIVGVATYNVVPYKAGLYFNKIQCFCFEEQWLNPNEEVDMPVFFYIDPDFDDDPDLAGCTDIALSYTFFKAKEGMQLPLPGFMQLDSVQNISS